ncbi:MAG: alpha/beta hydrolase [Erythrobacter sp.]
MKWVLRIAGGLLAILVVAFLVFRTPDTDPAEMRAKYGGSPSQFVEIGGGTEVHLRDEGPGNGQADAPVVILLHGSNADLHTWEPWVEALADEYRVIRFDQVGHGLTGPDPRGDYSRANYVEDIREVADTLGLGSFVIGGSSMGGKHALAFAAQYPERVEGLILVGSSGAPMPTTPGDEDDDGGNIGFAIAQMPGINLIAEQITPRFLIAQSLEDTVAVEGVVNDAMIDRYWEMLRYPGNRAATMARFSSAYDPLTQEEIAAIDVPVLVLHGAKDGLIPASAGRWLADTLPDASLRIYPEVGHLPHEEAPGRSLEDVRQWLDQRVRRSSAEDTPAT